MISQKMSPESCGRVVVANSSWILTSSEDDSEQRHATQKDGSRGVAHCSAPLRVPLQGKVQVSRDLDDQRQSPQGKLYGVLGDGRLSVTDDAVGDNVADG